MLAVPSFQMPEVRLPRIPKAEFHITDYGAVGDGITINTAAFACAIDACAAAGGGKVVIPPGIWLTGPIGLKSYVELHAERGALVTFSPNAEDYPLIVSRWEGNQAVRSTPPLHGTGLEHVAITGEGIFDGNGDAWRPVKRFKMTEIQWNALLRSGGAVDQETGIWWPNEGAMQGAKAVAELTASGNHNPDDYVPYRSYLRPVLLSLRGCKHILLDSPTFQNSPGWNLHLFDSEHITIRRVTVRNPWYSQNGDGLDLESCRHALVEDSAFDVGDDAICMKSGKNKEGRLLGKPVEYVTVRRCTVFHGHGGFVIGSEMSGGARYMDISDCEFVGTDCGLRFKSTRGRGGVVEHIRIRNIRMKDIGGAAISFNMFYEQKQRDTSEVPVSEETPVFRGMDIEDVHCVGAGTAIELKGLPEMPIRHLSFHNVLIQADHGVECKNAADIVFERVTVLPKSGTVWDITDSRNVTFRECGTAGQADLFASVSGSKSEGIQFSDSKLGEAAATLRLAGDVKPGAVKGL
ncbi:glycoside hydrolase family 28 protein [Paenibacillus allorhizosphaerae]|uniref:Exo-poly-alpha-D-galacturonosidase n=1 Tax=Paenibacillus allorhizosphaerae TaxID=2849866 RepID=A0ABN7THP9_9BACL|nr:glycoside hydrolase family 28 protein [Paenibacillus allorhizosphaerae]CAG7619141.1 Exo-poly-alpha-D-galacturonosidase [Paenibacillus allorhizosphaerae]